MNLDGQPRRTRRLNKGKVKRLILLIACVYAAVTMGRIVYHQESSKAIQREDHAQLTAQIEAIKTENQLLERKIDFAGTDAYIERIARDQLGYVKEGEIRFIQEPPATTP